MIHATSLIWTKIKRGCGPSCETTAGVWKKALNATVPWGFCPLPARGYRASDRCRCCCCCRCCVSILISKCVSRYNGVRFLHHSSYKSAWTLCCVSSKCASRHSAVHFFHFSTAKSAPEVKCFDFIAFRICFVPHVRAIFHLSHLLDGSAPALEKTQRFATFLPFRGPASSFFFLLLFLASSHLCFSMCPYCRKFDF